MSRYSPEATANLLQRDSIRFVTAGNDPNELANKVIPSSCFYYLESRIATVTTKFHEKLLERVSYHREIQLIAEYTPAADGYFGIDSTQKRRKRVSEAVDDGVIRQSTWSALERAIEGEGRRDGAEPLEVLMWGGQKEVEQGVHAFTTATQAQDGSDNCFPRIYYGNTLHDYYEQAFNDFDAAVSAEIEDASLDRITLLDTMVLLTQMCEHQQILSNLLGQSIVPQQIPSEDDLRSRNCFQMEFFKGATVFGLLEGELCLTLQDLDGHSVQLTEPGSRAFHHYLYFQRPLPKFPLRRNFVREASHVPDGLNSQRNQLDPPKASAGVVTDLSSEGTSSQSDREEAGPSISYKTCQRKTVSEGEKPRRHFAVPLNQPAGEQLEAFEVTDPAALRILDDFARHGIRSSRLDHLRGIPTKINPENNKQTYSGVDGGVSAMKK